MTDEVNADTLLRGLCVVVAGGTPDQDAVDSMEAMTAAIRRVRTKEGARKYGQSIGTIIKEDTQAARKAKIKARLQKAQQAAKKSGRYLQPGEVTPEKKRASPGRGVFVSGKSRKIGKISRRPGAQERQQGNPKITMADGYLARKGMAVRYKRGDLKGRIVRTFQTHASVRFNNGTSKVVPYTQLNRIPAVPGKLDAPNVARKKKLKATPATFTAPDVARRKLRRKRARARVSSAGYRLQPNQMSDAMLRAKVIALGDEIESLTASGDDTRRKQVERSRLQAELNGRPEVA